MKGNKTSKTNNKVTNQSKKNKNKVPYRASEKDIKNRVNVFMSVI